VVQIKAVEKDPTLEGLVDGSGPVVYRGTLLIRNSPPLEDHRRAQIIVILQGPRGALFLIREVPLQGSRSTGVVAGGAWWTDNLVNAWLTDSLAGQILVD